MATAQSERIAGLIEAAQRYTHAQRNHIIPTLVRNLVEMGQVPEVGMHIVYECACFSEPNHWLRCGHYVEQDDIDAAIRMAKNVEQHGADGYLMPF